MAEELQHLLERIQREGVEKAEQEARAILAKARTEAEQIVAEARNQARSKTAEAEKEADAFLQRATRSLEQAARDVVLSVGEAIGATLERVVTREVREAMDRTTLRQMLVRFVEAYCGQSGADTRVEVLVSPSDQQFGSEFVLATFAEDMRNGIEIKADDSIVAGFRATLVDEHVEHDFTDAAATEAVCTLLRPRLAEIVRNGMAVLTERNAGDENP